VNDIEILFENNRNWAQHTVEQQPTFFSELAKQQSPHYLWIGCSDSRVPANQIIGLLPGEVFVHRNIANVVVHSDLNCLSVIQYAVEVLKVKHIIVCGHYGCGGVTCAYHNQRFGLIDNWLRHIQDIHKKHLNQFQTPKKLSPVDLLCQLNVIEQAYNVCQTTIVQDAWMKQADLEIHGWIYSLQDGLLQDLGMNIRNIEEIETHYHQALETIFGNESHAFK
jgi:carbonic anhydrase